VAGRRARYGNPHLAASRSRASDHSLPPGGKDTPGGAHMRRP